MRKILRDPLYQTFNPTFFNLLKIMQKIIEKIKAKKQKSLYLLFICSGNICRSPMAEILCEKLLQQFPLPFFKDIIVKSAAVTYSWTGGMSHEAALVLNEFYQIPQTRINQFKSCHIDRDASRCRDADLIIVMEQYHISGIPEPYKSKTFMLSEVSIQKKLDIDDPYGGSLTGYKAVADEIFYYLQEFLKNLRISF
jgi:protein-tyrosine phosphatase